MKAYQQKKYWKFFILAFAMLIGGVSLLYTRNLVKNLSIQEDNKIKLWADATRQLINAEGDINFLLNIIEDNETIPTILVDDNGTIITTRNLDAEKSKDSSYLISKLADMKNLHEPIQICYDEENKKYNYLYYENSELLNELKTYPFIQLGLIAFFAMMSYLAISSSRKAEQNQVWVGMSKETAHQLGTPISSLREWLNLIKENGVNEDVIAEFDNDIKRLELITERFSKIGSEPALKEEDLKRVIDECVHYLKSRVSSKVNFEVSATNTNTKALMNISLFEWVIENICKNAIDAMNGSGNLTIQLSEDQSHAFIEISDTGKGIPRNKFKTIFKPGFTTKKRGWGLGLSLSKRIINEYHKGDVFVKQSELGKGTTFKIALKKAV
jgi:anti-sigma regulatory factor (Ser/Thr protein kinase)